MDHNLCRTIVSCTYVVEEKAQSLRFVLGHYLDGNSSHDGGAQLLRDR